MICQRSLYHKHPTRDFFRNCYFVEICTKLLSLRNTVILEVKFNFHQFQLLWNPYLHWKTVILLQSLVSCIQTNTTNQQFGTINGVHAWVVSQLVFIVTLTETGEGYGNFMLLAYLTSPCPLHEILCQLTLTTSLSTINRNISS